MAALPNRITIESFKDEMDRVPPGELTLRHLRELVARLHVDEAVLGRSVRSRPGTSARRLVCRTARFDMRVLTWRPGRRTAIHDHAGSLGVTRVHQGELTSRLFVPRARPGRRGVLVELADEERIGPGGCAVVGRGEIHQLANESPADLVTLHVYARPLRGLHVHRPDSGAIRRVPLRRTLESELADVA